MRAHTRTHTLTDTLRYFWEGSGLAHTPDSSLLMLELFFSWSQQFLIISSV